MSTTKSVVVTGESSRESRMVAITEPSGPVNVLRPLLAIQEALRAALRIGGAGTALGVALPNAGCKAVCDARQVCQLAYVLVGRHALVWIAMLHEEIYTRGQEPWDTKAHESGRHAHASAAPKESIATAETTHETLLLLLGTATPAYRNYKSDQDPHGSGWCTLKEHGNHVDIRRPSILHLGDDAPQLRRVQCGLRQCAHHGVRRQRRREPQHALPRRPQGRGAVGHGGGAAWRQLHVGGLGAAALRVDQMDVSRIRTGRCNH
mmetsp:Transcript_126670/g.370104  ORF Transcript_126670/g.370104 Transcript_126670/m.370104 type:complete len:263 (+) Transcript_126670:521-1309(+)